VSKREIFRASWWLCLTAASTWMLYYRLDGILQGTATWLDGIVGAVWIVLILSPLFREISFAGLSVKRDLDDLKDSIESLHADVKASSEVQNNFNPTLNLSPMLSDEQLDRLADRVAQQQRDGGQVDLVRDESAVYRSKLPYEDLVLTRFAVETIIRDFYEGLSENSTPDVGLTRILRDLVGLSVIDNDLMVITREFYTISSMVIHNKEPNQMQLKFAYDVQSYLLPELNDRFMAYSEGGHNPPTDQ
jgi:hypothetical protein